MRGNAAVFQGAGLLAESAEGDKMQQHHEYAIASITKLFTASRILSFFGKKGSLVLPAHGLF